MKNNPPLYSVVPLPDGPDDNCSTFVEGALEAAGIIDFKHSIVPNKLFNNLKEGLKSLKIPTDHFHFQPSDAMRGVKPPPRGGASGPTGNNGRSFGSGGFDYGWTTLTGPGLQNGVGGDTVTVPNWQVPYYLRRDQ